MPLPAPNASHAARHQPALANAPRAVRPASSRRPRLRHGRHRGRRSRDNRSIPISAPQRLHRRTPRARDRLSHPAGSKPGWLRRRRCQLISRGRIVRAKTRGRGRHSASACRPWPGFGRSLLSARRLAADARRHDGTCSRSRTPEASWKRYSHPELRRNRHRLQSAPHHRAVLIWLRAVDGRARPGRKLKLADVFLSAGSFAKLWQLTQEPGPGPSFSLPV